MNLDKLTDNADICNFHYKWMLRISNHTNRVINIQVLIGKENILPAPSVFTRLLATR